MVVRRQMVKGREGLKIISTVVKTISQKFNKIYGVYALLVVWGFGWSSVEHFSQNVQFSFLISV